MKPTIKTANDLLLNLLTLLACRNSFDSKTNAGILEAISKRLHKIALYIYSGENSISDVINIIEEEYINDQKDV